MTELQKHIKNYLNDCKYMKGLSSKTIKAYSIVLRQFSDFCVDKAWSNKETIEEYIKTLYSKNKTKTAKEKE